MLIYSSDSTACLNYYVINTHGEHHFYNSYAPDFQVPNKTDRLLERLSYAENVIKEDAYPDLTFKTPLTCWKIASVHQKQPPPIVAV